MVDQVLPEQRLFIPYGYDIQILSRSRFHTHISRTEIMVAGDVIQDTVRANHRFSVVEDVATLREISRQCEHTRGSEESA